MDLSTLFIVVGIANSLPPGLLESVCYVESGHNPRAYRAKDGSSSSLGMCQVKESTCRWLGFKIRSWKDLQLPEINIACAGKYLAYQIQRYRDVKRGVCAYNRGQSTGNGENRYTRKVYREWRSRLRRGQL